MHYSRSSKSKKFLDGPYGGVKKFLKAKIYKELRATRMLKAETRDGT
jgi:hypothetical protein